MNLGVVGLDLAYAQAPSFLQLAPEGNALGDPHLPAPHSRLLSAPLLKVLLLVVKWKTH